MKLLFLSRWYPYPADNGARLRIFNLIRQLSTRHEVSLVSFTSEPVDDKTMREWCVRVQTAPYTAFNPTRAKALAGLLSPTPRSFIDTHSHALQHAAQAEAARFQPDVILASQIDMLPYGASLPARKRILEELELAVIRDAAQHGGVRSRLTWAKTARYVSQLLCAYNGCTVVSEAERANVAPITPDKMPIGIVPNGVDVQACAQIHAELEPESLVYNGALTYRANFDAVDYFAREVLPLIQHTRPNVKLYVTGKLDGVPVERLPHNPAIIFTGYLNDVKPRVAQSWVTIAPLRVGGGTRLKILESLALGTPVVASSKGAEGLDVVAGRDMLIADSPAEFAAQVTHVLASAQERANLSANGRAAVAKQYDWRAIGQKLNAFIDEIVYAEHISAPVGMR